MFGMIWLLVFLFPGSHHEAPGRSFEGSWGVDMGAEQRTSDAGPFFDRFSLHQGKTGMRQEIHLLKSMKAGERLSLFYPADGSTAVASLDGRALYTSSFRQGQALVFVWQDARTGENRTRNVLTISSDGRTLTLSTFLRDKEPVADQVVVLRRLDKTGKVARVHNR